MLADPPVAPAGPAGGVGVDKALQFHKQDDHGAQTEWRLGHMNGERCPVEGVGAGPALLH